MIQAGIIASSHTIMRTLKVIKKLSSLNPVAFYDPETSHGKALNFHQPSSNIKNYHDFLSKIDAVLVCAYCNSDIFYLIELALKSSKHVYISDPLCLNIRDAQRLIKLTDEIPSVLYVGNLSDIQMFESTLKHANVRWINIRKTIATGNDFAYELKHCISQSNHILKSELKKVDAFQLPYAQHQFDIGEVRIEFFNGMVMNIQLTPDIWKKDYCTEIFSSNGYMKFDFNNEVIFISDAHQNRKSKLKPLSAETRIENELFEFESQILKPSMHTENLIENRLQPINIYRFIDEKMKRTSIIC